MRRARRAVPTGVRYARARSACRRGSSCANGSIASVRASTGRSVGSTSSSHSTWPATLVASGARVLYRDGAPLATSVAGQVEWLDEVEPTLRPVLARALAMEPFAQLEPRLHAERARA